MARPTERLTREDVANIHKSFRHRRWKSVRNCLRSIILIFGWFSQRATRLADQRVIVRCNFVPLCPGTAKKQTAIC